MPPNPHQSRIAIQVLNAPSAFNRPIPGSTDPEEVEQRMRIAKQEAETKLGEQAMLASLGGLGLGRFKLADSGVSGRRSGRKVKGPSSERLIAELEKDKSNVAR